MKLDLTDEEADALARLLRNAIDADRYPLSPRVQMLKGILAKIRPEAKPEPPPPPKRYEPPRSGVKSATLGEVLFRPADDARGMRSLPMCD